MYIKFPLHDVNHLHRELFVKVIYISKRDIIVQANE